MHGESANYSHVYGYRSSTTANSPGSQSAGHNQAIGCSGARWRLERVTLQERQRERFNGVFCYFEDEGPLQLLLQLLQQFYARSVLRPASRTKACGCLKVTARVITTSSEPQDLSDNTGAWPHRRSCSGKRYAVGSLSVRSLQQAFQRMARLEQTQVLEGHTDRVWNVAWSPKGTDILWAKPTLLVKPSCWSCI